MTLSVHAHHAFLALLLPPGRPAQGCKGKEELVSSRRLQAPVCGL